MKIFVERHRELYEGKSYFRLNVQQGLQDNELIEYKSAPLIDTATGRVYE